MGVLTVASICVRARSMLETFHNRAQNGHKLITANLEELWDLGIF